MKLILKLAIRDLKNSKRFVLLFVANLSLGILGFLLLHSFKTNVNSTLESRSKILLASDISISGRRDLTKNEKKQIDVYLADKIINSSEVIELYSMGQSLKQKNKRSRLSQIKIITNNFPLFGHIKLQESGIANLNLKKSLGESSGIWISKELAHQFKLERNDKFKIGEKIFEVKDIIEEDTTSSWRGIGLAPKLYLHMNYKEDLKLLSFGSVANYSYQYSLVEKFNNPKSIEDIKSKILNIVKDPAIKVLLPKNSSEQVGRVLNYLADYLGLVALVSVFLSGIGAAFLFQNFVFKRVDEIGVLKSLGLELNKIYALFLTKLLFLGVLGVSFAIFVASILLPFAESYLTEFLKMPLSLNVGLESVLVSYTIGIVIVLVICFPILIKLLKKSTIDMFAGERNLVWNFSKKDYLMFLPLLVTIELLSIWQSHSIKVGTAFTICLVVTSLIIGFLIPKLLTFFDKILIKKSLSLSYPLGLSFGLGLRTLFRNKIVTTITFLAVSLGVMLLSLIGQLEVSINSELLDVNSEKPSLFMFDIQSEQKNDLQEFLKEKSVPMMELTPMVRARIIKLKGEKYTRNEQNDSFQTREDEAKTRFRNRGINLTYASEINSSQTIIEGQDFKGSFSGKGLPEVSVEHRYASRMGLKIGDTMTFEILGVEIQGQVTSLRKIKWTSFLPNFFITIQPGVLEDAPQSYLLAVKKLPFSEQLRVQDLVVEKFSNISIINVTELVEKIMNMFSTMSIAIKTMAILCIIVGFFVIFAIIQNQVRKKQYDILLMKSFGMKSSNVFYLFLNEFLLMSILATIVGSIFSLILGNLLSVIFFEGIWQIDWKYLIIIMSTMTVLTVFIVFISTFKIYNKPIRELLE
jgi:putative ABC transport system permease protein